jgi:hypothetical protein
MVPRAKASAHCNALRNRAEVRIMVVLSLNALGLNEKSDQGEGSHAGFSFGFRIQCGDRSALRR